MAVIGVMASEKIADQRESKKIFELYTHRFPDDGVSAEEPDVPSEDYGGPKMSAMYDSRGQLKKGFVQGAHNVHRRP